MNDPLDKSADRISRLFGEVAPRYDFLNHFLSLSLDRRWRARAANRVADFLAQNACSDAALLDVATGTGDLLLALDRAATRRKLHPTLTGVDFSSGMLELAARKIEQRHRGNSIRLRTADALNLPFPDSGFAAATVAFGIRNMSDPDRALRELVRVVRPGGLVGILEFTMPEGWLFGPLYRLYFKRILPRLGRLFSTNRQDAYRYLYESVAAFDDRQTLAARMARSGLIDVVTRSLTFGTVTWYEGFRP